MNSLESRWEVSYQNDIQHSYMVIKLKPEEEVIDYQVRIIQENPSLHLLNLYKKQVDQDVYIYYDITSKITLSKLLKRKKLNKHEFLSILKGIIKGLKMGRLYLLEGGSFLLNCDYIYVAPATLEISLAYMPVPSEYDICDALKALIMDLVVYKVSFQTSKEGDSIYELLSLLKTEDFSIKRLESLISALAMQGGVEKASIVPPLQSASDSQSKEEPKDQKKPLFMLTQLFFAALTALAIRYYYLKKGTVDISAIAGIVTVMAALNILLIRRLKLIKQLSFITQSKNGSKLTEVQKLQKMKVSEGLAAALEDVKPTEPKNLETVVMMEDMHHFPCLIGCGANQHERIYIDKPSFIIGRIKSQVDYVSGNNAVGKLHAEIIRKEDKYYLKDLNSRNGTYINGERIISNVEYPIQHNDRIAFANSEYLFHWK